MSLSRPKLRFETLPADALRAVLDLLPPWEIKQLSRASKQLREWSLPFLFRNVEFQFSRAGFEDLRSLLKSDARHHIICFTYTAPELLKPEILDFNRFKSDILTPESYAEEAKEMYDEGYGVDPSYMIIYDTLHITCEEQRSIVDEGVDYTVLSSVLGALPRLTEACLRFRWTVRGQEWLGRYVHFPHMIMPDRSCQHHIKVVSNALRRARNGGVRAQAVNLLGFKLWARDVQQDYSLNRLSRPLTELLRFVQILRLTASHSALEVLSLCALDIHQFDMCSAVVNYERLEGFLEGNKKSIRSIGFHNVQMIKSSHRDVEISDLSSDVLRCMLSMSQSTPCQAADCGCCGSRENGWRLVLDDHLKRTPAKRKHDESITTSQQSSDEVTPEAL